MRAIDRKLFRDLLHMKGQVLAIALVMACGVATFVMSMSVLQSLEEAMRTYYARHRFADVFAQLKRAPNDVRGRLAEIEGVAQLETRITRPVTLDVKNFAEPIAGRLISLPAGREPSLNLVYLRRGRWIDHEADDEALMSESFADAHGLDPGDRVSAVLNGKLQRLAIVGVVLSPEFIYSIREGDLLPDDARFGVLWMSERQMEAAFNMDGAFNDVGIALEPGAIVEQVIAELDALLEPYGSVGAYGRSDHPSHKFVANEINELGTMALIAPSIFLGVAAFLINVVISRLIVMQRQQIATLKAIGYGRAAIGVHYLKFVIVIACIGSTLGVLVGAWLGRDMTVLYTRFFHFPVFAFTLNLHAVAVSLGLCLAAALAPAATSVWRATRLAPAAAMQPEPPHRYQPTIIENLGLQRFVPVTVRMILRQLERRPLRSLLSCVGIALAVSIIVVGSYVEDALDYVMHHQFEIAQRQDLTVSFAEPTTGSVGFELAELPGVIAAEPFRALPARLRAGPRSYRLGIMGLPQDATLFRLIDDQEQAVRMPGAGIVLTTKLAEILEVREGDRVVVEVLEAERPVTELTVSAIVTEFTGVSAYMSFEAANRLMQREGVMSGAFLAADSATIDELYRELKLMPRVVGVNVKAATLQTFRATIAENLLRMRFFNLLFACVIAVGVIYNTARIALSERARELATLRVVGFTRSEISFILLGELAILTFTAIPLGLTLGYFFALAATQGFDSELFRMPLIIERSTYGLAAIIALAAATISGLIVRRRLDRLDLIGVLKTRE